LSIKDELLKVGIYIAPEQEDDIKLICDIDNILHSNDHLIIQLLQSILTDKEKAEKYLRLVENYVEKMSFNQYKGKEILKLEKAIKRLHGE